MIQKVDEEEDLDNGRSWVVAVSCCFCNLMLYGVSRLSGLMLVAVTHAFGVSRANAAVPFSLSTALRNLAGLFVGYLGHRFGVGPIVALGCVLASLGSGLCYFAKDILWLTLCWGGLFGIGFGLSTCLLPLAINQNFKKHNGTASGISYSGAYIGSFVFPPIVVWLKDNYGLQGTFLIISGAILNLLVAAMFLKKPKRDRKSYLESKMEKIKQEYGDINHNSKTNSFLQENVKYYLQNNGFLYSEINNGDKNMIPNIFKNFCFKSSVLSSKQIEQHPKRIQGIYLVSAMNIRDDKQFIFSSETEPKKTSLSKTIISRTFSSSVKQDSNKYRVSFDQQDDQVRSVFKRSFKDRYQNKLYKFKGLLNTNVFKKKNQFSTYSFPNDNVKLTSFKRINYFLCYSSKRESKGSQLPYQKMALGDSLGNLSACDQSFRKSICFACKLSSDCKIHQKESQQMTIKNKIMSIDLNSPTDNSDSSLKHTQYQKCSVKRRYESLRNFESSENSYYKCNNLWNVTHFSKRRRVYEKTNNLDIPDAPDCKEIAANCSFPESEKVKKRALPGWIKLLGEFMFVTISITMSLHTFIVVCVVTTIEDFAKDVGIQENRVHFALMALSVADLIGSLTLGFITDRGFISRRHFLSLCFLGMSLSLIAISIFADSLPSMLSLLVIYGLLESGVIITFPVLMKEFVKGKSKQAIAIASSNALSAPTVMLVPMLIGHFRDHIGSYSGLFHLLGATSFTCCLLWLVVPSIHNKRNQKKLLVNDC